MTLADDLLAPAANRRGGRCHVSLVFEELQDADPKAADALTFQLTNKAMPATILAKRLTDGGYPLSVWALQRHRRGDCLCR